MAGHITVSDSDKTLASKLWEVAQPLVLPLAIACPAMLFLTGILLQGPEYDEAISLLNISGNTSPNWPQGPVAAADLQQIFQQRATLSGLLEDLRNTDVFPPLHYLALWLIQAASGTNLQIFRALSMLAVLAGLFLLVEPLRVATTVRGPVGSTVLTLIFLTGPAAYYAATTARSYALAILFLCLAYAATLMLLRSEHLAAGRRGGRAELFGAATVGLACGLAVMTHYMALFAAAALAGIVFLNLVKNRRWPAASALVLTGTPAVLVAIYFLYRQIHRGAGHFAEFSGPLSLSGKVLFGLFAVPPNESLPPTGAILVLLSAALSALIVACAVARLLREPGERAAIGLPLLLIAVHIGGLVVLSFVKGMAIDSPRYMSLVWPFAALTLAHGTRFLLWPGRAAYSVRLALPILLIAANTGIMIACLADSPGANWGRIARAAGQAPDGALLVVDAGYRRGTPAAIALSAPPAVQLWIVTPDRLSAADPQAIAGRYHRLDVALSYRRESREAIGRWFETFARTANWDEQETGIPGYRRFVKREVGGRPVQPGYR